jgi:hypothetical protein
MLLPDKQRQVTSKLTLAMTRLHQGKEKGKNESLLREDSTKYTSVFYE